MEKQKQIAAFFDIDGTLTTGASLERRLAWALARRREISATSCAQWLLECARLAPMGLATMTQRNKRYLAGITVHAATKARAHAPAELLPLAMDRIAWHARQGHRIVLISGTLEFLADEAREKIESVLVARGLVADLNVRATRLESRQGRWTGRLLGEPVYGEEKARVVREVAYMGAIDLALSYAYGNAASDRWMLETVGKPAAVNADRRLARIAARNAWPLLKWIPNAGDRMDMMPLRRSRIWHGNGAMRGRTENGQ